MYFSFSEKCIVKRGVFFFLKFKGKTILFSQVDVHVILKTKQNCMQYRYSCTFQFIP